jgi:hypothetical protein
MINGLQSTFLSPVFVLLPHGLEKIIILFGWEETLVQINQALWQLR